MADEPISGCQRSAINPGYHKATNMPPAADENHPPAGVPDEPEDAEGEETDEYDIEVGDFSLI